MELYKHQKEFLETNPNKIALVWSTGTGKTATALNWLNIGDTGIVICPKALRTNWIREAKKWGSKIIVYTKEEFRKEWDDIPEYKQLIVDECHNGFLTPHFKSQMSKSLRNYIKKHNVPRILLLSATVYTSSPWNIYQLAIILGHKWNWIKFNYEFFDQIRMGIRTVPVPKKNITKKLANLTKKIASVVDINDCIDVPPQIHCDPEYFSLTKEQEKAIEEAYDPLPIVRYTMQHEIENGVLLANEFRALKTFDCDKNERITELVKENDKVAIVCRYNAQIDVLSLLLKEYKPYIIRGDVKDRDAVTLAVEEADKVIVLVQADCAEGYNLPSIGLCIFASMSYSYAKFVQICGRFLRINKPTKTTFVYLLTEGDSLDQAVYNSINLKKDFSINLYNKK